MLLLASTTGCVLTLAPSGLADEPPVTPPVILDVQGVTEPRLHNLVTLEEGGASTAVRFSVPVDDDNVLDRLQFQFFIDDVRDCVPRDGGTNCEPQERLGELGSTGDRRRVINRTLRIAGIGCHRVELWVSSNFQLSGNFRTPVREGDVSFATWWIFLRSRPGMSPGTPADGGVSDPVERCGFVVQP